MKYLIAIILIALFLSSCSDAPAIVPEDTEPSFMTTSPSAALVETSEPTVTPESTVAPTETESSAEPATVAATTAPESSPKPTVAPTLEPTPESTSEPTIVPTPEPTPEPTVVPTPVQISDSARIIEDLFNNKQSDVQVRGYGIVIRTLSDDNDGDRHQRFILEMDNGQTLLVAHNIDIAPRLEGIDVGDNVEFYGEYVYSEQGGTIHWTHRDDDGSHVDGYLIWNGTTYA
ncbi:MAG: DUF3465 domain-containing protein [Oscillospiraceae bacterium]|jgi:hypothetical protein|nr:DUF3465 domain-containing protein [Oscillospiraceae bacterium]